MIAFEQLTFINVVNVFRLVFSLRYKLSPVWNGHTSREEADIWTGTINLSWHMVLGLQAALAQE